MNCLSVDFLTVHFGDPRWTQLQIESVSRLDPSESIAFGTYLIVDNARDGKLRERLPAVNNPSVRIATFPVDEEQVLQHGHDHGSSLEQGLAQCHADLVVLLDCDAHLVATDFYEYLKRKIVDDGHDAIAAGDPRFEAKELSHPCFMVLNRNARNCPLPWDPSAPGNQAQTGRMVTNTLTEEGLAVHTPQRVRQFGGVMGDLYDGQVYHHGSATFSGSSDPRLTKQIHPCASVFQNAVLNQRRYHLTKPERLRASLRYRWHRIRKRVMNEA